MLTPYGASFWINVELKNFSNQSPSLFCAQNYYCFLKFRRISQLEQKLLHGNHFVYMMGTTTMETCPWNNNFAVWLYIFSLFGFFFFLFFLIIHVFSVKNHRHYTCKELLILSINFNLKCTCRWLWKADCTTASMSFSVKRKCNYSLNVSLFLSMKD